MGMCYTDHMKRKIVLLAGLIAMAALIFWFFYPLRSYVVMGLNAAQHSRESVIKQHGFSVDIPSGRGWNPFVLTYNAEGFAAWSGVDADMSILYNFGAFDARTRTSSFYDLGSDKYSAFYGAYVLNMKDDAFGLTDGADVDMDEITRAVEYDYTQLVLGGFGCETPVFRVDDYELQTGIDYAGSSGWTCIDADITTNGVAHLYKESKMAYLQYGPPTKPVDEDFAVTTLQGRLYIKYLEQYDCTVMLYVIAPSPDAVDACDAALLSKTVIADLQQ